VISSRVTVRWTLRALSKHGSSPNSPKNIGSVLPFGKLKHMRNWIIAQEYYSNYGKENIKGLLLFLLREYGRIKVKHVPSPQRTLDFGIWWPKKGFL
jgi:cobaltochelatase CobN